MAGFTLGMGLAIAGMALAGSMAYSSSQKPKESDFSVPQAPSVDDASAKAKEATDKKRRASARNTTNYTGPLGLSDEDKSGLATKTMLGQ